MKRHIIYIYALAALLLAGCNASRHRDMLAQLEELERQNVADSLMTNDSLAQALTEYFDRHGTPNEQLRAHYILGRTYADLGEAPAAVQAYLDAAERADTTASDCDWAKISRVYGQMGDVYYRQELMNDCLDGFNLSEAYAWKAGDTIQALNMGIHKVSVLLRLHQDDAAMRLFDYYFDRIQVMLGIETAAKYGVIPIKALLKKGDTDKARRYLDLYEKISGYVDSAGFVGKGREVFYYYKGAYYLKCGQYDSADNCFRRELREGKDFFNQNMAANGLARLYLQTHQTDSSAKYALFSYDMMDSVYERKATADVERMAAVHVYSRHQHRAVLEFQRAERERHKKSIYFYVLVVVLVISSVSIQIFRRNKKKMIAEYVRKTEMLTNMERDIANLHEQRMAQMSLIKEKEQIIAIQRTELVQLRNCEADFSCLIRQKEEVISNKGTEITMLRQQLLFLEDKLRERETAISSLQKEISTFNADPSMAIKAEETLFADNHAYQQMNKKLKNGKRLSEADWKDLEAMLKSTLPKYQAFLFSWKASLLLQEYRICILLRLHVGLKESASLMGIQQQTVSKICSAIMSKLFDEQGSGKQLIKRLEAIV